MRKLPLQYGTIARNASTSKHPSLWKGLVGYWPTSLGPSGYSLQDISGFGNHGTLPASMDPATDWIMTEKGWTIDHDGTIDEVFVSTSPVLFGMSALSLVSLFRYTGSTSTANEKTLVSTWDAGDTNYLLRWDPANNQMDFFIDTSAGIATLAVSDLTNIEDAEWHMIVATYDGATMRLNLDCVESATTTSTSGAIDQGGADFRIGGYSAASSDQWIGQIAATLVFRRVITPNEIQTLYLDHLAPARRRNLYLPYGAAAAPPAGNPGKRNPLRGVFARGPV